MTSSRRWPRVPTRNCWIWPQLGRRTKRFAGLKIMRGSSCPCSRTSRELPWIARRASTFSSPGSSRPGTLDRRMGTGDVKVPEGHKVVAIGPSPKPFLARAESGTWILNFGDGKDLVRALDELAEFVGCVNNQSVIWIVQAEFLAALPDVDGFLARLRTIVANSKDKVRHLAVFAKEAAQRVDVMAAFKQLGIGVHYSAPDGACFVEVHRPDGIVVGMPGKAFDVG